MDKRVKVSITGYYTIDMSKAEEDYGTSDPDEMLKIDTSNIVNYPTEIQHFLEDDVLVVLEWEK
jgi:hypothetical protein